MCIIFFLNYLASLLMQLFYMVPAVNYVGVSFLFWKYGLLFSSCSWEYLLNQLCVPASSGTVADGHMAIKS